MYEIILFDLDGTLTDPGDGITSSVAYALRHFGITAERKELERFIGPPLIESFEEFYGFSREQSREALRLYREYFTDRGIFENRPYEGIREMLSSLCSSGKRLSVATSKPHPFAKRILDHFDLSRYFDFIAGSELDETRTDKGEVIAYALDKLSITDISEVLMVGDRLHDVVGAAKCGVDCAGVLYGYGSKAELVKAGAKYLCNSVDDVSSIIIR